MHILGLVRVIFQFYRLRTRGSGAITARWFTKHTSMGHSNSSTTDHGELRWSRMGIPTSPLSSPTATMLIPMELVKNHPLSLTPYLDIPNVTRNSRRNCFGVRVHCYRPAISASAHHGELAAGAAHPPGAPSCGGRSLDSALRAGHRCSSAAPARPWLDG